LQHKFLSIIKEHETHLKKYNTLSNIVGYIKLLFVLLLSVLLCFLFTKSFPTILIAIGLIELVALTGFWIYHNKIHTKIDYSISIISINKRHLDRISGKWSNFTDIGAEFVDFEHPYSSDIDIVGKKSVFQFLNTTHTWHGRQAFASALLQPHFSTEELIKRQNAVMELNADINFSNHMEQNFSKIGTSHASQKLVEELKDNRLFIKSKAIKFLLIYMPIVTVVAIAAIILFGQKDLYIAATIIAAMQLIIWVAGMLKIKKYMDAVLRLPHKLNVYSEAIEIVKNQHFNSKKLKEIQSLLGTSEQSAAGAIKGLSKISDKISVRSNGLVWFILNVFLLWDYSCAIMFEDWKTKYAPFAEKWFLALGEFESLLCFSNLPNIYGNTCIPSVIGEKTIVAKELGHPLIQTDICVNNNISCENNIFIISGSNMSGKSTFLRTVGINLVLGRAGGFVCAKQMNFSQMKIMTSMRIADDLNEGISTFYAELKRIKSIMTLAKQEPNMIFLIDEIFRGTNSADRFSGAKTVISKLNKMGVIGIITTHDLDLCTISEQYSRIKNYSFSEHYRDDQIHFDYKMKEGKSTTTNAQYLMKMVGIE